MWTNIIAKNNNNKVYQINKTPERPTSIYFLPNTGTRMFLLYIEEEKNRINKPNLVNEATIQFRKKSTQCIWPETRHFIHNIVSTHVCYVM